MSFARTTPLIALCWVIMLAGCNGIDDQISPSAIPQEAAGIWQAQAQDRQVQTPSDDLWAFQIAPDGSIPKFVHPVAGQIVTSEGGVYKEGPDPGTFMQFDLGEVKASYNLAANILTVHVVVDRFRMKLPTGELAGKLDDFFEGPLTHNGTIWRPKWWSYSQLEGADPVDRDMVEANPDELVFHKVDLEQLRRQQQLQDVRPQ